MEEKKNAQGNAEKLSYEQLNKVASELSVQNKKMVEYIQNLQNALAESDFSRFSFFMTMLFKVMDHVELYDEKFVAWCTERIETGLQDFAAEPKEETSEEKKDEA